MLFSATTTKKTEDLIKLALKKEPIYIGLEDQNKDGAATVKGLEQVWEVLEYSNNHQFVKCVDWSGNFYIIRSIFECGNNDPTVGGNITESCILKAPTVLWPNLKWSRMVANISYA